MRCEKCGAEISEGQTICPACLTSAAPPPAPEAGRSAETAAGSAGPIVPPPGAPQAGPAESPPPGYPPAYPPYAYAYPYGVLPPQPRRQGKPVLVIIIAIFTFLAALTSLAQVGLGKPDLCLGVVVTGPAVRLLALGTFALQLAVAIGLVMMSRWGWWLAILLCLIGALSALMAVPQMGMMLESAMQGYPLPPPPEAMPILEAVAAVFMAVQALLQMGAIAYLVWKRDLFGIDVAPAEDEPAIPPSPPAGEQQMGGAPPEPPAPPTPPPGAE